MQLKARVRNLALKNHLPAQAVLQNFMLERLLERVSVSQYKDRIVLKGGMLIASLVGISSRTTMDMDATLRGYPLTEQAIQTAFGDICSIQLDDDVTFILDHIAPIREADEYGGYRVAIIARYESIRTPLKVDVTTGDVITPGAVQYSFQSVFGNKAIEVWAYTLETILAEKVETILRRSVLNTRMRDFYDVFIIVETQNELIDQDVFRTALQAASETRGSLSILQSKNEILQNILSDPSMRQRWELYCNEYYYAAGIAFDEVLGVLTEIIYKA
jgi:predicted nucleotidyltransferase component of viral defense system